MALVDTTWITSSLLEEILRRAEKDESIRVSAVTLIQPKGNRDNYGSNVHRVTVKLSKKAKDLCVHEELALIFKVAPDTGPFVSYIIEMGLFPTEIFMLSNILPKFNEILRPLETTLSARTFHVESTKPAYLVIEDLTPRGYRLADSQRGLDLKHALLTMTNIAKFHASSVALREKEPEIHVTLKDGMFRENQPTSARVFFTQAFEVLARESSNWPNIGKKLSEKVRKFSNQVHDRVSGASRCYEDDFVVLNHGDLWVNNLLFRYDNDDEPRDQIFVDFQHSVYGSPALDLHFLLSTSLSENVRENHRELLLHEYHSTLSTSMALLGCTTMAPSFESFRKDLERRFWLEAIVTLVVWPSFVLDVTDWQPMEEEGDNTENIIGMRSKTFQKVASKLLLDLDRRGLLDT